MNNRFHKYDKLPDNLNVQDLYSWVSKNSDDHEPAMKYRQPLSEEELNDFRTKFADEAISLNEQKEEMQEEVRVLKKRIKEVEGSMASKLKVIQEKEIEIIEPVFMFKDTPTKSMVSVNSEGIIVHIRELQDYEMQMSIPMTKVRNLHGKKNGTDDIEDQIPGFETF